MLIDAKGNLLCPIIAWFDQCGAEGWKWWKKTFSERRILEITGLKPQYIFAANKILWLKSHEHEQFQKAYRRMSCV